MSAANLFQSLTLEQLEAVCSVAPKMANIKPIAHRSLKDIKVKVIHYITWKLFIVA